MIGFLIEYSFQLRIVLLIASLVIIACSYILAAFLAVFRGFLLVAVGGTSIMGLFFDF